MQVKQPSSSHKGLEISQRTGLALQVSLLVLVLVAFILAFLVGFQVIRLMLRHMLRSRCVFFIHFLTISVFCAPNHSMPRA